MMPKTLQVYDFLAKTARWIEGGADVLHFVM